MTVLIEYHDRGEAELTPVAIFLPFNIGTPATATRSADPVIAGTGVTGTLHTASFGTISEGFPQSGYWMLDGGAIDGATGMTFTPTGDMNGGRLSFREVVDGAPLDVTSNAITLSNPSVLSFPSALSPSLVTVYEITSGADPDVSTEGRRRLVLGSFPVPTGFELRWYSGTVEGGGALGSVVTPGSTTTLLNNLAVGTPCYNVLSWRRLSDGAIQNALPSSGTTANGKTITATVVDPTVGQVAFTIVGTGTSATTWQTLGSVAIADAMAAPIGKFIFNGPGGGSNIHRTRNACVAVAYESFRGNTATDARTLQWLASFLTPTKMPFGCQGPASRGELSAVTFLLLVKRTPRLYDALTTTQKNQMEWIIRGELISNAFIISDSNPRPNGNDMHMGGDIRATRSIGPDISCAPVGHVVVAACYLGPNEAINFLKTFTMSGVRSQLAALFGTNSYMYRMFNWRNEGVSAADATTYVRMAASSLAPTDATIEGALRNFAYYGAKLPDLETLIMFPNEARGFNKVIPHFVSGRTTSNPWVGKCLYAVNNNNGVSINGVIHGAALNSKTSIPYSGESGVMIYDLNGQDDGGFHASMPYTQWVKCLVDCVLLALAITDGTDMNGPDISDFTYRWNKANIILNWIDEVGDWRSCSHNTTDASGNVIATKHGGPGLDKIWSVDKANTGTGAYGYCIPAHKALWDVIKAKLNVPDPT